MEIIKCKGLNAHFTLSINCSISSIFIARLGSSLHEVPLELRTILALLYSHTVLHSSSVWFLFATAPVHRRSSLMVELFNHSNVVDINDRHVHGCYHNAACDGEKSVHHKRTGERSRLPSSFVLPLVLYLLLHRLRCSCCGATASSSCQQW